MSTPERSLRVCIECKNYATGCDKCTRCGGFVCISCLDKHEKKENEVKKENETMSNPEFVDKCCRCNSDIDMSFFQCTKCSHGIAPCEYSKCGLVVDAPEFTTSDEIVTNATGGKQSDIKCRPDMTPLAELRVGEICDEGNRKYDKNNPMLDTIGPISPNWHKISAREHLIHAKTHINKCLAGIEGEDHIGHATCRMLFALEMELRGEENLVLALKKLNKY